MDSTNRPHQGEGPPDGNALLFTEGDLDVLRTAVGVVPELELAALALKRRKERSKEIPYPLKSYGELFELFDGAETKLGHHRISAKAIERYVHPDLLPIEDDEAFVRVVFLGMGACNAEMSWALQAPPDAEELLAEARKEIDSMFDETEG